MTSSRHEKGSSCRHVIHCHEGSKVRRAFFMSDYWQSTCCLKACLDISHYVQIVKQLLTFQFTIRIPKLHHALMQGQSYGVVLQRGVVIQLLDDQNGVIHSCLESLDFDQWRQHVLHQPGSAMCGSHV